MGEKLVSGKQMSKGLRFLIWFLFVIYIIVLVNVIILKDGTTLTMAKYRDQISLSQRIKGINFVPLKTIIPYLKGEPSIRIAVTNLLGNIWAFSPLGFLLPFLLKKCESFKNIFLISFGVSLFIEVIQLIFYLGSSDIDDLILNVIGSIVGYVVYFLLKSFYERKFVFDT